MTSKLFIRLRRLVGHNFSFTSSFWISFGQFVVDICSLVHAKAQLPNKNHITTFRRGQGAGHVAGNHENHGIS